MKFIRLTLMALLMTVATASHAKQVLEPHVYMFGFSASFKDSVVYITNVQDVQGAWIDSKTKFLLNRDSYSYQLKEHMTEQYQEPDRVCIVFYATNKKKIEKQLKKLRKKYKELTLLPTEFHFEVIEQSEN